MTRKRNLKRKVISPIHKIFVNNVRKQIKKIIEFKNEEDGN
jgi:hypothetical protein